MAHAGVWLAALALSGAAAPAPAQPPAAPAQPAQTPAADSPPAKPAPAKPTPKPPPAKSGSKTVEGLTVTGARADVETSIDRKSYSLGKDLQASTGSIADALRNLPSVDVDLQGNLTVRGDANVTILVDGKPSPEFEGKGRADALQQLPADQYERVEVITNPSAALNPEGSGGVINLITKKSRGAGRTGSVYVTVGSAGLKRAGATLGYNSPRLSVTASVSGNYQHNKNEGHELRVTLDPETGAPLTSSTSEFIGRNTARGPTARLNLTFSPTAKDQLTGAVNYNELLIYGHPFNVFATDDAAGALLSSLTRQGHRRFEEIDKGLTVGWKHTFGEDHDLSLDLVRNQSRPHDHTTWTTFEATPPPGFTLEAIRDDGVQDHSELRLTYRRPMPGHGKLSAGYELKFDDNLYLYQDARGFTVPGLTAVPALANNYRYEQTINAGYVTYEQTFGALGLEAGLRVEDTRWTLDQMTSGEVVGQDYVKAFPTLHLSYRLDDDSKLTGSFSLRLQRPPSILLNPRVYVNDPQNIQVGNPDLQPTNTASYELGYQRRMGDQDLQATLFYRDIRDEFVPAVLVLGGGVFANTVVNEGYTHAAGLELTANGKIGPKLSYNASLTPYWAEVNAFNPLFGGRRSVVTASGRINMNWQATGDDLLQLNANFRNRGVGPQGYFEPSWTLNFGWRRKLTDRLTATLTAQDLLATNRFARKFDTPVLIDRFEAVPVTRAVFLRFDYRFGGSGRPQPQDFQYENGGGGPPG
jgi:outer membrane receptor protein involved in Fe transport